MSVPRVCGQFVLLALFAALLDYFSVAPSYAPFPTDQAQIKVSFSRAGAHRGGCRQLTAEELAKLPPNMRAPLDCPRGRLDVVVELDLDDRQVLAATLPPGGLAGDGEATIYRKLRVAPGRHRLAIRMRDSARDAGFDHVAEREVMLEPAQNFVIDFDAAQGGFVFH